MKMHAIEKEEVIHSRDMLTEWGTEGTRMDGWMGAGGQTLSQWWHFNSLV